MMLVLCRKPYEDVDTVVLTTPCGERIEVVVLSVRGSQIKLGFRASQHWRILRGELEE